MTREYAVPAAARGSVLGQAEIDAVAALVRSGAPLSAGRSRTEFEERFAEHLGAAHALTVTSGTVALRLAVDLLDLREGDEVIATPQTYQATVQPLLEHPVRVRFCDVDPDSLALDAGALEALLTDRTRAIMLVHYGGYPADLARILELARARGAVVVEDCAHALGATRDGRHPGSLGDIGCFSFQGSKNITTLGEGGMVTVHRSDWAERIERTRGNDIDGEFVHTTPGADVPAALPWMKYAEHIHRREVAALRRGGTNATMSEASAAVGLVQLAKLDTLVERRRSIAARLDAALAAFAGRVRVPAVPHGVRHSYHLYTFFVEDPGARDRLLAALDRRGVEIQLRYYPQHLLPEWRARGHRRGECPVAERLWFDQHVNLPCHPGLTDEQVDHLVGALVGGLREVPHGPGAPSGATRATGGATCPIST
ncbi:aminotransferase DegT [Amycolatopsis sp. A1MSW2902]|uniref:DegT/DnrJ/EryC1/StrS family aminotransferase n=1 Tax=Amycolatopsis sp. A1MSW2902 TaxID=687413 RepID=UPI00307E7A19